MNSMDPDDGQYKNKLHSTVVIGKRWNRPAWYELHISDAIQVNLTLLMVLKLSPTLCQI